MKNQSKWWVFYGLTTHVRLVIKVFQKGTAQRSPRVNVPDENGGIVFPAGRDDVLVWRRYGDGRDVCVMQNVVSDRGQVARVPDDHLNLLNLTRQSPSKCIVTGRLFTPMTK